MSKAKTAFINEKKAVVNNKDYDLISKDKENAISNLFDYNCKSFIKPTKQSVIKLSKKTKVIDIEKLYDDSNELIEYIWRRKNGRNIKSGVIVGNVVNGVIKIGWSKCNISEDPFIPFIGLNMARARIMKNNVDNFLVDISDEELNANVPDCIRSQVRNFGIRCLRYYKDTNKLEIPK
jgi:hypothetical protein